jgi:hypothetical protein
LTIREHYALISGNVFPQYNVISFKFSYLSSTLGNFLQTVGSGFKPNVGLIITVLIFGCTVHAALNVREIDSTRALAASVLAFLVLGAWVFVFSNYLLMKQFVPIPGRYGLPLLAPVLVFVGRAARGRVIVSVASVIGLYALAIQLLPFKWR